MSGEVRLGLAAERLQSASMALCNVLLVAGVAAYRPATLRIFPPSRLNASDLDRLAAGPLVTSRFR